MLAMQAAQGRWRRVARSVVLNATEIRIDVHASDRQLFLCPSSFSGFRLPGQIEHEILQHEPLADGIRPKQEVSTRDAPNCIGEFPTRFVTPRLTDDIFCRKRRKAEPLPQCLPEGARVANVALEDDQHLPKGARKHVQVADGGLKWRRSTRRTIAALPPTP